MKWKHTGVGTRALNFFVDVIIVLLLSVAAFKTYKWYVFYYKMPYYNFGWFFFGCLFLYYFILESIFSKTPGKWVTQTKVVNQNGFKPSLIQFFVRSLTRIVIIDMLWIPFIDKTLHDYLSKTEVVEV